MVLSWAVLRRELGVESRRPANYRLRFWLGAAVTLLVWFALLSNSTVRSGRPAFFFLHNCMMALVLLSGPAIAADCLSREKREGTLGLLFLTPLSAWEIVSGKFLIHFLKLGTFWALALPLISVPLMQGGVSGREIFISFLFQFITMLLVLAGSILASTFGRRWLASLAGGYLFSVLLTVLFFGTLIVAAFALWAKTNPGKGPDITSGWMLILYIFVAGSFLLATGTENVWSQFFSGRGPTLAATDLLLGISGLLAIGLTIWLLRYSARRIQRFSEQEMETKRQAWFRRVFLTPLYWRDRFRQSMRLKLDNNPFIWLEYRSAWSRSGRWLLVFVIIFIETCGVAFGDILFDSDYSTFQVVLLYGLASIIAFTASSSFQKERECGAFELLLVAPLQVAEIIWGRLKALWTYYCPAIVTLIVFMMLPAFWGVTRYYSYGNGREQHLHLMGFMSLVTVPFLGLYFSLRFKNFIAVLMPTLFIGLVGPAILADVIGFFGSLSNSSSRGFWFYFLGWIYNGFPFTQAGAAFHVLVILFSYSKIHTILTERKVVA